MILVKYICADRGVLLRQPIQQDDAASSYLMTGLCFMGLPGSTPQGETFPKYHRPLLPTSPCETFPKYHRPLLPVLVPFSLSCRSGAPGAQRPGRFTTGTALGCDASAAGISRVRPATRWMGLPAKPHSDFNRPIGQSFRRTIPASPAQGGNEATRSRSLSRIGPS
jgi:hypothetical protein